MLGRIGGLIAWLGLSYLTAAIGGIASIRASEFYQQLERPEWAPPSSWFGPVWTTLYFLMGVAAWLVWRRHGFKGNARTPLVVFVVQLVLNALWSWLFFAWRMGGPAIFELLVLWALILTTIILFWRVDRIAGALLVPYLAWVTFAGFLNFSIWQSNPQLLG